MPRTFSKTELLLFALGAVLLLLVIPALHAAGGVSDFSLSIWGKYLCYAVLAISVDLLWGYTGLLSLGQALFFALGGYMLGMHLVLMIRPDATGVSEVPDVLAILGHTYLPSLWRPFYSFSFALAMVVLVPLALALSFGWLAFRARIKGVYYSILTQALTFAASLYLVNSPIMGGTNGFTNFRTLLGTDIRSAGVQRVLFICTAVLLLLVYAFCRWLTSTRFGLIQRAIRDSETRVLFSGYPVARYKLFIFAFSAVIASLAGSLFVTQVAIINPSEMAPEKSLEAVVWCAVGGRGTLVGPILGCIGVNALKSWASHDFPDYWPLLLGGLFIVVVVFMPGGVMGLPAQLRPWLARLRRPAEDPSSSPPASPQKPVLTPVAAVVPEEASA